MYFALGSMNIKSICKRCCIDYRLYLIFRIHLAINYYPDASAQRINALHALRATKRRPRPSPSMLELDKNDLARRHFLSMTAMHGLPLLGAASADSRKKCISYSAPGQSVQTAGPHSGLSHHRFDCPLPCVRSGGHACAPPYKDTVHRLPRA